jgi:phospholipid transport system substrate-binding protein
MKRFQSALCFLALRAFPASLTVGALSGAAAFVYPSAVRADAGAQGFVESEQSKLQTLLRTPVSPQRDTQINAELDHMVDYGILAKRAFGSPCPASTSECQDHWKDLSDAQRSEVTDLLKKLVQKNYRKNLLKTLDYDTSFRSSGEVQGDTKVRTVAKSKLNAREAPTSIDYLVTGASGNYHVVDIVTEGSSLTKNYYKQFHTMLTTADQGYPHVLKKLREKIAENK